MGKQVHIKEEEQMKTIWKLIIISLVVGLIIAAVGFSTGASQTLYWDNKGIHLPDDTESRITEPDLGYFSSIDINTKFCDVEFVTSDKYGVDACGYGIEWDWSLDNNTLKVATDKRMTVNFFNINISFSKLPGNYVKIYIPKDAELGTVIVDVDSGEVDIGGFRADSVRISNAFGTVKIDSISSDTLQINQNSGDFTGTNLSANSLFHSNSFGSSHFSNVIADRLKSDGDSTDISFDDCKFNEITVKNSFGKITGRDIISSRADIKQDSGDISLTGDFTGETIIRCSFGSVDLTTSREKTDYMYDITAKFGDISFDNESRSGDGTSIKGGNASENSLKINVDSGDVDVRFAR